MRSETLLVVSVFLLGALSLGLFVGVKVESRLARDKEKLLAEQYEAKISDLWTRLEDALADSTILRQMVTFTGTASWYGDREHGRITANNERFSKFALTAASKLFPFNSLWRVTNLKNRRETIVRISDDGPNVSSRIIDLSQAAAREIGMERAGTAQVLLTPIVRE